MKPLLDRRTPCLLALVLPWSGQSLCPSGFRQSRTQHRHPRHLVGRDGSNAGGSIRESLSSALTPLRLSPIDPKCDVADEASDRNDLSGDREEEEEEEEEESGAS
ncbi:hypothetical protein THAOC_29667, partial [Thalassiosira oceanica]